MLISFLLAVNSFFSFPTHSAAFLEENWFSPSTNEEKTHFIIHYPHLSFHNKTEGWISTLFQKLLYDTLLSPTESYLLAPPSAESIYVSCPQDELLKTENALEYHLDHLKQNGFTQDKISHVQTEVKTLLNSLRKEEREILETLSPTTFTPMLAALSLKKNRLQKN